MRDVREADNGVWCVVEDGRWFPFGKKADAESSGIGENWSYYENHYMFFIDGKAGGKITSKGWEAEKAAAANPLAVYYDKKFIQNLKAQTPLFKLKPGQIIPVDFPDDYYGQTYESPASTNVAPAEPKKKAMPAVPEYNGRKFREEE